MYNTQNHCVFGLYLSSEILSTSTHIFFPPSMVWVRERTMPTERPPLVGEAIANFLRIEGATWSAWRIPSTVFSVIYTGAATFLSSSSSVVLTRLSGPRSRPTSFLVLLLNINICNTDDEQSPEPQWFWGTCLFSGEMGCVARLLSGKRAVPYEII
jgi:hypothetical protein